MVGLRMPSNRTLGKICVYGAVASVSAVMYMRWKLEDRVKSCDYYKLALKGLRSHRGAVSLLGEPIKDSGIDLGNPNNNCNAHMAQFEVSVRGSKDKGTLYFWASHQPDKGWLIDRLELETKLNPEKRFLLKKSDEQTTDLPESLSQLPAQHELSQLNREQAETQSN
ncbi:cytochrome c oxidase assembly factor 1 homolog [Drosophila kikkawai]|uniref:Cytochrome c oxidase assembly factor 1 homolog n=1 Tax=Drosophila kikkawai TaxID=30033 RepID=A0A6P4IHD1_DROKI|nr:uncharacterized protein LOC108078395 [Drosophila kikkawai]